MDHQFLPRCNTPERSIWLASCGVDKMSRDDRPVIHLVISWNICKGTNPHKFIPKKRVPILPWWFNADAFRYGSSAELFMNLKSLYIKRLSEGIARMQNRFCEPYTSCGSSVNWHDTSGCVDFWNIYRSLGRQPKSLVPHGKFECMLGKRIMRELIPDMLHDHPPVNMRMRTINTFTWNCKRVIIELCTFFMKFWRPPKREAACSDSPALAFGCAGQKNFGMRNKHYTRG